MNDILKEKEEVQLYLKNLGIEYRFSCFSEKNPEGCQLLADYLIQIDSDYVKANKVLQENCDVRNHPRSCSSYGTNLLNGNGCVKNPKEAMKYFTKSCELDDAMGCDCAGKIYGGFETHLHDVIEPDPVKGLKYLDRGCNIKSTSQLFESTESCYAGAFLATSRQIRNYQKSIELGAKACEAGHMNACQLVSNVYQKINDQNGYEKFLKKYKELKKQIDENVELRMQRT
ncbi:hypothetical protein NH340_JMT04895 [Sarcoptes scabiei]|nr:hypothetical protein NH340_JMT04895 [Sarcoptes scabiei]